MGARGGVRSGGWVWGTHQVGWGAIRRGGFEAVVAGDSQQESEQGPGLRCHTYWRTDLTGPSYPSVPLLVGLKPGMVLMPLQTSLVLFCWSFLSSFLAYSRSRVFSSLVLQVTYWVNFGSVFLMETSLKSPEIIMRALGCVVCSPATIEWMTSHADVGLADGGIYTATTIACENSQGK